MASSSNRTAKVLFTAETKEFTSNINKAKSILNTLRSEMKLNETTFRNTGDAISFYTTKQNLLQQELEQSQTKIQNLHEKLDVAKRIFGEGSEEVQHWTRMLNTALSEQQRIEASLNDVSQELTEYTREQERASSSLGQLNTRIETQENQLKDLKQAYVNACIQFGRNSTEARELAVQITEVSNSLNANNRELREYEDAADDLDLTLNDVEEDSHDLSEGFTVMKGVIANLVTEALEKLIDGLKEVSQYVLEAGMNFEVGMSKVEGLSGASADEMDKLTDKAKEMGETTKFSASESAEAFSYMAMAGWKASDMLDGIEGVMNMASATCSDLGEASDILTDAMTGFGLSANEAGHFANVMTTATTNANTNVTDLGEAMKYVSPLCKTLGYSVDDAAVAIGLMANSGIKGSQAGTSLRTAFSNLANPTDKMKKSMDSLGISMEDSSGNMISLHDLMNQLREKIGGVDVELTDAEGNMRDYDDIMNDLSKSSENLSQMQQIQAAATIFGKNSMSGMLAIINSSEGDYNKLTEAIDNCDNAYGGLGSAMGTSQVMIDNLDGDVTLLKSQMEGLSIAAYEKFQEPLRNAISVVSETFARADIKNALESLATKIGEITASFVSKLPSIIDGLISFGKALRDNIEVIKAVGAGIATYFVATKIVAMAGFVMSLVSKIKLLIVAIKGAGLAATAFSLINPVTLAIAGVAALVAGFVYLWNTCDAFKQFWLDLWAKCKEVMNPVVDIFKNSLNRSIEQFKPLMDQLKKSFDQIKTALEPILPYLKQLGELMGIVSGVIAALQIGMLIGLINGIVNALAGLIQMITGIVGLFTGIITVFIDTLIAVGQTVVALFQGDTDKIGVIWSSWASKMGETLSGMWESIKNIFAGEISVITGLIGGFVDGFIGFMSSLYETVVGEKVPALVNDIQMWFRKLPENAISSIISLKNGVINGFNSMKSSVVNTASNIKESAVSKFNSMKSSVVNTVSGLKESAVSKFNSMKSSAVNTVSNIKDSVVSKFSSMKSSAVTVFDGMKSKVVSVFTSIKTTITNSITTAKNTVKTAIDAMKGFFNFNWSLPKIKLPHFSVSGSANPIDWLDEGTPSISVSWYKKGGIFTKPTLFNTSSGIKGVGEAGAEAVLPLDRLQTFIDNSLQKYTHDDTLINAIDRLANRPVTTELYVNDTQFAYATAGATDYVSGNRITLTDRGVAK